VLQGAKEVVGKNGGRDFCSLKIRYNIPKITPGSTNNSCHDDYYKAVSSTKAEGA